MKTYIMVVALVCAALVELGNAQELYWTDDFSDIRRAPLFKERQERRLLVAGPAELVLTNRLYGYLAFDPVKDNLYYTASLSSWQLYRSELDGTEAQLVLNFDVGHVPLALAIDPVGRKIYWSSTRRDPAGDAKIARANLDGSGAEDLVTGMTYPYGIALDLAGGKMFWIRQESQQIWRANLDGSQAESILALGDSSWAFGVAVSPKTSQIFWSDAGTAIIGRANLDGSDPQVFSELELFAGDGGITVDPQSRTVFWGDTANHLIYAADLDGGRKRAIVSDGVRLPGSMVVVRGNKK